MHRRRCRRHFPTFAIEALRREGLAPARHHRYLCECLQAVADGRIKRLIVLMPPGSAKSTYASKLFPAWLLGAELAGRRRGRFNLIGASNTQDLADSFSRDVQNYARDNADILRYRLRSDAVARWWTEADSLPSEIALPGIEGRVERGIYRAAGVGGTITGHRADGGLIDDPIRSREDADSEGLREKQWNWLLTSMRTRLKPGGFVVLILTHWHEDDMAARAVLRQPGLWHVVRMCAVAEDPAAFVEANDVFATIPDPLGRRPGEWLWDDDDYAYAAELKAVYDEYELSGAKRDWAALYQQRPAPAEGILFNLSRLGYVETMPVGVMARWRAWDLAATEKLGSNDPDWTAGVKMAKLNDGQIIVEDVVRERRTPEVIRAVIRATAEMDGVSCRISIPQDPGQAGKEQAASYVKHLEGFRVDVSPESGDKTTRAEPFISQVNVGNVKLLRGGWNGAYRNELAGFGAGGHDDQVDASSRAYNMLLGRRQIIVDQDTLKQSRARVIQGRR